MNQGWQCPVCKTVWAPTVQKCAECSPVAVPTWIGVPWPTWPGPHYPWYVASPTYGPITVTYGPFTVICTSTQLPPEGYTYTVYNDPGVSVYGALSS